MIQKLKNKIYKLLRKSEKYTKTDMVYLVKGGFWLSFGKIISSISAFALSIAFANLLSSEDYGTYKYILAIVSMLGISSLPGMNTALITSVAKGYEGNIKKAIKIKFKWSLLGAIMSLFISLYYFLNSNTTLSIGFLIAGIFMPIIEAFVIYGPFLQGRKLFKISAIYSVITQLSIVISIILALFFAKKIVIIIFLYYVITALVGITLMRITLKKYKLNNKTDKTYIKFGKNLSVMNVIGTIASKLDQILMWHFLGATPLAIYSFAIAPITQIQGVLKSINILSLPKFSSQDPKLIKKNLNKKINQFILTLIIPVIIYIIIAPWIYKIFFPQYISSVVYSQIFSISLLFFPQRLISQALTAHEKTKILYKLKIINSSIKILLLSILLPLYGIIGAIFALIFPQIIDIVLLKYYLTQIDKTN